MSERATAMADGPIMEITDLAAAITWQADHAERAGAPITARMVRAELAVSRTDTAIGRRLRAWPGLSLEDALPLRLAGALHWLHLTGAEPALGPVYAGDVFDQAQIDQIVIAVTGAHDLVLLPWLDHPPQTNEAGRSSSLTAGLLWLGKRLGPCFEVTEIGASAGVNTMMERYRYDLGGVEVGPAGSPMSLRPDWRGSPPPVGPVEIVSIRGCDVAPVDLSDPAEALRLKAYVWADAPERLARIDAAAALASQSHPDLVAMDAGAFVTQMLARPQAESVTRVLVHSVMWQYLAPPTRSAITAAMEMAGAAATRQRPLAWLALETNRETFRHELTVRYWPGGGDAVVLSNSHPHGAWINWRGSA
ncbi:MAG: DUF2332 domain-containing protein [Croceibacterium sp.]